MVCTPAWFATFPLLSNDVFCRIMVEKMRSRIVHRAALPEPRFVGAWVGSPRARAITFEFLQRRVIGGRRLTRSGFGVLFTLMRWALTLSLSVRRLESPFGPDRK